MSHPLTRRRDIVLFHAVCFAVYFASYCTRINYGASVTAVASDLGVEKQAAGIVSTGLFITYGIGQLISGILGDRIPPHRLILAGLLGASVLNIAMGLCSDIPVMTVLWCLNGFFQSLLWPPLVRIMSELLDDLEYRRAVITVSVASTGATIVIYLLVPLCITLSGWRLTFSVCAALGLFISAVWFLYMRALSSRGIYAPGLQRDAKRRGASSGAGEAAASDGASFGRIAAAAGLAPICCAIVVQGAMRDGVQTWMPAFIDETYHLGESISILTAVVLPIFATLAFPAATWLKRVLGGSELVCSAFLFGAASLSALILLPLLNVSPFIAIPLMSVITASMHGVNLMLISHIPQHFSRYGCVSTVSGLLNSTTYIGSALSTWGIALLSETRGWFFTIAVWAALTAAGFVICRLTAPRWNSFTKGEH